MSRFAGALAVLACALLMLAADASARPAARSWHVSAGSAHVRRAGAPPRSTRPSHFSRLAANPAPARGAVSPALSEPSGGIAGTVTSFASDDAIGGIEVCAFDDEFSLEEPEQLEQPLFGECAVTDAAGEYQLSDLQPGGYTVEFAVPFGDERNYLRQLFDDASSESEADLVSVSAGAVTPAIDAALHEGGQIKGAVTDVDGGVLEQVEVCAFDLATGFLERCALTNAGGEYTLAGLATGEYDVEFFSPTGEFMTQYYEDASDPSQAKKVAVVVGSVRSSIDATLRQEVPIADSPPRIAGGAVEGQTLQVVHGSWLNNPTSYDDEWGRCASSGEIASCHTVAVGASYTPTAADVGHTIRVRESAANASGSGRSAISAPSAPVAGALAPVSPPSSLPPAGASGVLATMTAHLSVAQIRTLLATLLTPTGRNARIGTLLERDGYTVSLDAPSAGKVTVSWYLVPRGAHLASVRPVLAAIGRLSFNKPGVTRLTVKLTAKGRRLLEHAARLKLTAKGALAPSGQTAVDAIRSFTLRH